MSMGIPTNLLPPFERVRDGSAMLHVRWPMYRQPFAASGQRVALLNAAAGGLFGTSAHREPPCQSPSWG
jgi:hypothetical protein